MKVRRDTDFQIQMLEQRERFLTLRVEQDAEIRGMMADTAEELLMRWAYESDTKYKNYYQDAVMRLQERYTNNADSYSRRFINLGFEVEKDSIHDAIKMGVTKLKHNNIDQLYARINEEATAAMWNNTRFGKTFNKRIWDTSTEAVSNMSKILTTGMAGGDDVVTVARQLEVYILQGKSTLAQEYPNMMERMGLLRIPEDLSYEALRLARTEMTRAFGDATRKGAEVTPGVLGIKFELSSTHPVYDICDELTGADDYGLGPGIYPVGKDPYYPFHPNCGCIMSTVHEPLGDLVDRLLQWEEDPSLHPDLENWYQERYMEPSKPITLKDGKKTSKEAIKRANEKAKTK